MSTDLKGRGFKEFHGIVSDFKEIEWPSLNIIGSIEAFTQDAYQVTYGFQGNLLKGIFRSRYISRDFN